MWLPQIQQELKTVTPESGGRVWGTSVRTCYLRFQPLRSLFPGAEAGPAEICSYRNLEEAEAKLVCEDREWTETAFWGLFLNSSNLFAWCHGILNPYRDSSALSTLEGVKEKWFVVQMFSSGLSDARKTHKSCSPYGPGESVFFRELPKVIPWHLGSWEYWPVVQDPKLHVQWLLLLTLVLLPELVLMKTEANYLRCT